MTCSRVPARCTDRLELASWLACVLLAVAVVPLALAVASVVASDAGAEAARQAAERQQVPAVLVEDAEIGSGTSSQHARAVASWTSPDGTGHEDTVPVPAGAGAGEAVLVWIGPDGSPAGPPLGRGDVVVVTVTAGALTLLLGLSTAAAVHAGVCTLLDRARDRAWTREWAAVEPLWAARFRLR
ncbi:Rv1733c family protein [Geodermatophilus amargosae]|uniref:Rv1733c family protein n=1 Tax=Geodermatophilus amargosae TaxID=1296565 RepID=UPI0034DF2031